MKTTAVGTTKGTKRSLRRGGQTHPARHSKQPPKAVRKKATSSKEGPTRPGKSETPKAAAMPSVSPLLGTSVAEGLSLAASVAGSMSSAFEGAKGLLSKPSIVSAAQSDAQAGDGSGHPDDDKALEKEIAIEQQKAEPNESRLGQLNLVLTESRKMKSLPKTALQKEIQEVENYVSSVDPRAKELGEVKYRLQKTKLSVLQKRLAETDNDVPPVAFRTWMDFVDEKVSLITLKNAYEYRLLPSDMGNLVDNLAQSSQAEELDNLLSVRVNPQILFDIRSDDTVFDYWQPGPANRRNANAEALVSLEQAYKKAMLPPGVALLIDGMQASGAEPADLKKLLSVRVDPGTLQRIKGDRPMHEGWGGARLL